MVCRRLAEKILFHPVARLSDGRAFARVLPGSHSRGGSRAGQINPALLPGAGNTRTVLGGPLQCHPRGLRSQCRFRRDRDPAQHRGLRLLVQQRRRDRLAQALRLQAGLYAGYRPLQLQLRGGRSSKEPPGPRVQRQVLFLHDPGNPGHPRAEENSARECPEKLRGGRRAEKVRRGKALRRPSGLREIGAGPLQPGSVGRQPPEEPLGAELPHRHAHYRRGRDPGGPDLRSPPAGRKAPRTGPAAAPRDPPGRACRQARRKRRRDIDGRLSAHRLGKPELYPDGHEQPCFEYCVRSTETLTRTALPRFWPPGTSSSWESSTGERPPRSTPLRRQRTSRKRSAR